MLFRSWNAADGTEHGSLAGHPAAVEKLAFSPDGRWVVYDVNLVALQNTGFCAR